MSKSRATSSRPPGRYRTSRLASAFHPPLPSLLFTTTAPSPSSSGHLLLRFLALLTLFTDASAITYTPRRDTKLSSTPTSTSTTSRILVCPLPSHLTCTLRSRLISVQQAEPRRPWPTCTVDQPHPSPRFSVCFAPSSLDLSSHSYCRLPFPKLGCAGALERISVSPTVRFMLVAQPHDVFLLLKDHTCSRKLRLPSENIKT